MDVVQENNSGDALDDAFVEKLLSTESADVCDGLRDLEMLPRVGDDYQVEIPSLIAESHHLSPTNNPTDIPHSVAMGQPIPIMWIKEEVGNNKHESPEALGDSVAVSGCIAETHILSERHDLKPKVESMDTTLDGMMKLGESPNLDLQQEMKTEINQKHRGKGYCPVPGSAGNTWSDSDEASFLLSLYIFGKNLVQVKKFVGSKGMGEILSFYYGTFHGSDKYRRWSECRKMKSRRCAYGQRIFTGLRQQELLSRLQCHVLEECQNTLLEDFKAFGEGKISLEEYVFTLRARVGLNALVEAVGIGKGKQDLTGMAMEPLKSNQVVTVRPEIPAGKAWSKLTSVEIINFLTGGYRLSKARSSDLFWEAVWPRLLARGWHSEEPNNHGCAAGSKHSLVFLIPGIKKFSRRKLVKGNHYFDSVTDVLSKVAVEPGLLELETGADKGDSYKEENGWTNETELKKEDFPDQRRHCYLKPRTPSRGMDVMKFTVVDTSLANGGTLKVRELRSLPVEMRNACTTGSHSEYSNGEASEEPTDESDSSDTMCFEKDDQNGLKPAKIDFDKDESFNRNASNGVFPIAGPDLINAPAVKISDQKSNTYSDMQPRKEIKVQLNQRRKPDNNIHLAPVTKRRRRLTACNRLETTNSAINGFFGPRLKQDEARCSAGNGDSGENISFQVDPSQGKLSSTTSSKGSLITNGDGLLSTACSGAERPYEEPPPRRVIDLNLPILPDAETDEPFMKEGTERQPDQTSRQPDDYRALKDCPHLATSEQQPNMNNRRQSTRNRPLTTKALEALAFGFLNTNQKRRFGDAFPRENPLPSRRARTKVRVTENLDSGIMNLQDEGRGDDLCNDNNDMFSELHV